MITHVLSQLTPSVYWLSPGHETDRPVPGVIAGNHATLIVDAGNSPAHAQVLLDNIAKLDIPPPTFLALTHWHWDHVFGAAALNLPAFAHHDTKRIVAKMARLDWSDAALDQRVADGTEIAFCRDMIKAELPDRSHLTLRPPETAFSSEIEIDLGGVICELHHVGSDHSPDSIIIHIPQEKVVFLGDCIYHDLHHGPDRLTTHTLFPLLDRLRALDADFYVPAHHDEPFSKTQFGEHATLLKTIGRAVAVNDNHLQPILSILPSLLNTDLTDEHRSITEAFIAGLRMPEVERPDARW